MSDVSDPDRSQIRADEISAVLSNRARLPAIDRLAEVARSMETLEWQLLRKAAAREEDPPTS